MAEAFICDYVRTPIGRYAGALRDVRADDLLAHTFRALVARNAGVDWAAVDDCYVGCANQAGEDNRDVARMAVLLAGLPVAVPGSTLNRLCGSGLDAVGTATTALNNQCSSPYLLRALSLWRLPLGALSGRPAVAGVVLHQR